MEGYRRARVDECDLVARIAAASFYDDPVLRWVFPDPSNRLDRLTLVFRGLAGDMVRNAPVYLVDDACAALWRDPSFEHAPIEADRADVASSDENREHADIPFTADELDRLLILGATMSAAHPHDPHWYLAVLSTLPARQGEGLGGRALAPVLAVCDSEGVPAYLESTNPRNMTLYRRHGFVETGQLELPDGPPLYAMWRTPGSSSEVGGIP